MSDVVIPYLQAPSDIVNEALDALGADEESTLGDITDGTRVAETARRNYAQALRQLLRTAHWNFARKYVKLTLLGDATGQSAAPVIPIVEQPWTYAYGWPIDAVQGRWLPVSWPTSVENEITNNTGIPLTTGQTTFQMGPQIPGRFLVSSSDQYPIVVGQPPWLSMPDLQRTEGLGPVYRKTILTDVCNAHFVYTRLVTTIEEWDGLFRQAMVMMMALVLAPVAIKDPKLRLAWRNDAIPILRNTIADARVANGNEATTSASVDHQPVWITARNGGAWAGGLGGGGQGLSGYQFFPWDASMQWAGMVC